MLLIFDNTPVGISDLYLLDALPNFVTSVMVPSHHND